MDSQLLTTEVPQLWLHPLIFCIIGYSSALTMELVQVLVSTLTLVGLLGLRVYGPKFHFSIELALWKVISTAQADQ